MDFGVIVGIRSGADDRNFVQPPCENLGNLLSEAG